MGGQSLIRPLILGFSSAILFGVVAPFSKILLDTADPLPLASLLYFGAGIILTPFILWRKKSNNSDNYENNKAKISNGDLIKLLGAVIFGGVVGPVLLLMGIALSTAATSSLLLNLESAATAIIALIWFRENIGKRTWAGIAGVTVAGMLLTATAPEGGWLGGILIALACLAWGLDNNFTARIEGVSPVMITWIKGVGAGTISAVLAVVLGGIWPDGIEVIWVLLLGGLAYGASIVLYIESARLLGATRSQLVFATAPFMGFGLALILSLNGTLSENLPSYATFASIPILIGSLWLMSREVHEHEHTHHELVHGHWHTHNDQHHGHSHEGELSESGDEPLSHSHSHSHEKMTHNHPHWPDLHHSHDHL